MFCRAWTFQLVIGAVECLWKGIVWCVRLLFLCSQPAGDGRSGHGPPPWVTDRRQSCQASSRLSWRIEHSIIPGKWIFAFGCILHRRFDSVYGRSLSSNKSIFLYICMQTVQYHTNSHRPTRTVQVSTIGGRSMEVGIHPLAPFPIPTGDACWSRGGSANIKGGTGR